jgi:hypothetical protein
METEMKQKLSPPQVQWQGAALKVLLDVEPNEWDHEFWMPIKEAGEAITFAGSCTKQAAVGALRALVNAGLAERLEIVVIGGGGTGAYFRASGAARRAQTLILAQFSDEVQAIAERVEKVGEGVDEAFFLQQARSRIEAAKEKCDA